MDMIKDKTTQVQKKENFSYYLLSARRETSWSSKHSSGWGTLLARQHCNVTIQFQFEIARQHEVPLQVPSSNSIVTNYEDDQSRSPSSGWVVRLFAYNNK